LGSNCQRPYRFKASQVAVTQTLEQTFLRCTQPIGLVPGPIHFQEPLYSTAVYDDIALYPAVEVAATFTNLTGMHCIVERFITTADDWYDWRWEWQRDQANLLIDFTIFDTDDGVF
jgi:hypothetical protein